MELKKNKKNNLIVKGMKPGKDYNKIIIEFDPDKQEITNLSFDLKHVGGASGLKIILETACKIVEKKLLNNKKVQEIASLTDKMSPLELYNKVIRDKQKVNITI